MNGGRGFTRRTRARGASAAALLGALLVVSGCTSASFPEAPDVVGAGFPGTCVPDELAWPTDFLDSLAGEGQGIGTVLGLRLDYVRGAWMWRVRTESDSTDFFGDPLNDPAAGREVIMDVRTLEVRAKRDVTLTEAEQSSPSIGAWSAAKAVGETWPGPLVVDMTRVDGASWQVTLCDTETGTLSTTTVR